MQWASLDAMEDWMTIFKTRNEESEPESESEVENVINLLRWLVDFLNDSK